MKDNSDSALSKVPEVTLLFWIIKIAATTLGETGGDAVSMSMKLGYLVGTGIFAVFLWLPSPHKSEPNNFILFSTGRPSLRPQPWVQRSPTLRIAPWALAMLVVRHCC